MKNSKILPIVISVLIMLIIAVVPSIGAGKYIFLQIGNPYMIVNGSEKEIDEGRGTAPIIKDGRTLLPIRAVVEEMGGSVGWDAANNTVTLKCSGISVSLTIDSKSANINGSPKTLDTAPEKEE